MIHMRLNKGRKNKQRIPETKTIMKSSSITRISLALAVVAALAISGVSTRADVKKGAELLQAAPAAVDTAKPAAMNCPSCKAVDVTYQVNDKSRVATATTSKDSCCTAHFAFAPKGRFGGEANATLVHACGVSATGCVASAK